MMRFFQLFLNPFSRGLDIQDNVSNYKHVFRIRKQFRQNRAAVYALRFLYGMIVVAILAGFIANDKPLIIKHQDTIYFPIISLYGINTVSRQITLLHGNIDWKNLDCDWSVFPLIPYLPQNMDEKNIHSIGPLEKQDVASLHVRHWLGTDELGRDVFSGMIYGTRTALTVGLVSMGIAALIGVLLGSVAGYFGDERLKIPRANIIATILFVIPAFFLAFIARTYEITDALKISWIDFLIQFIFSVCILFAVLVIGNLFVLPLKYISFFRKKISVPVDIILSRFIEIAVSVPTLFLIISISALVAHPSIYIVMTIIGFTAWPGIARFVRAEMLRIRSLEYIEAARALGYSQGRILFRHALPNALSPVLITISFGVAAAILIEATLSFLGVGVSADTVTWGSLLAEARQYPSAWWLAILPGTAIFITVTILNRIGEALTDALNPKQDKYSISVLHSTGKTAGIGQG